MQTKKKHSKEWPKLSDYYILCYKKISFFLFHSAVINKIINWNTYFYLVISLSFPIPQLVDQLARNTLFNSQEDVTKLCYYYVIVHGMSCLSEVWFLLLVSFTFLGHVSVLLLLLIDYFGIHDVIISYVMWRGRMLLTTKWAKFDVFHTLSVSYI